MKKQAFREDIELLEGCQATSDNGVLTVKGVKGEAKRNLSNPLLKLSVQENKIIIEAKDVTKKSKKLINTYRAHTRNLLKGVSEGHTYKLKICSGHFPMTVAVKNNTLEIKNFIGEKVPRQVKITDGVDVKVDGSEIVIESNDKEKAGQMAASIEQLTRRPGFDKRIFQDGIYLIEKDGKLIK